jgi:hypothetical protein
MRDIGNELLQRLSLDRGIEGDELNGELGAGRDRIAVVQDKVFFCPLTSTEQRRSWRSGLAHKETYLLAWA